MPLVETVVDLFDAAPLDPAYTANGVGVTAAGGDLYVNASVSGGSPVYSSARRGGLTWQGSKLIVEVAAMPAAGANAQVWIRDPNPAATVDRLGFEYVASANRLDLLGQTGAGYAAIGATTSLTFDATAHRWLKIEHTGTSIVWSTSPTGVDGSWTVQRTYAPTQLPTWVAKTTLEISLEAYRSSGTNDTLRIASLNAPIPAAKAGPASSDALQARTLAELRAWESWLANAGATGHVGEFGAVTLAGKYGDAAEQARWNALVEVYLQEAETGRLWTTGWASGREWGAGYPLGIHVGTNVGDALSIANGTAANYQSHPSRGPRELHGVNLSGWEKGAAVNGGNTDVRTLANGYVHSLADFQYVLGQGVDTIRLPMAWERLQPTLGDVLNADALTTLDGMLTSARTAGVKVILDLHNYARWTRADGTVAVLGGALTNAQLSDFWTRLSTWVRASAARSATVVAYDVMNEPHDMPTGATGWEQASQAALTAIRNGGDTRTILVEGYTYASLFEWSTWHPKGWITDPAGNFRYSAHHYWDSTSALGARSGTYQQSSTGPILLYGQELAAAEGIVRQVVGDDGNAEQSNPATITTAGTTSVGDVLVAFHATDYNTAAAMTTPTGTAGEWTQLALGDQGANLAHLKAWSRKVTAAGAQTVTAPQVSGADAALLVVVLNGTKLDATLLDVAAGAAGAASTAHVAPSITPSAAPDLLLVATAAKAVSDYTAPSGMTKLGEVDSRTYLTLAAFSEDRTATGATGTRTATSTASTGWAAVTLAVRKKGATGSARTLAVGQTIEQGTATALTRRRSRRVGEPAEQDTAQALSARRKGRGVGEPTGQDVAQPVTRRRVRTIGQATEGESATSTAGRVRVRGVGQAAESDPPLPVSLRKPGEARQAREAESASPLGRVHARGAGEPVEAENATPLRRVRRRLLGQAIDTGTASSLARSRRRDVARASETDTVTPMGRRHSITLGQAVEVAFGFGIAKRSRWRGVRQATVTETSRATFRKRRRDLEQALTFDVALQLDESAGVVTAEAFAAAIADPDRVPFASLKVDWDGNGFAAADADLSDTLRSIEIERSLDGDLPEGAGLVDGYATATLKAELGGTRRSATMPLAAELSPFRPDAPRYGKRKTTRTVAGEIGLVTPDGPKAVRLFTGPLRDVSLEEGPRSVVLDAVDPSERLRALATLPTYGEFITHARRRKWALTVNSQALVDFCLRLNGIFASPPPRDEAIIVCTGHGGLFAERGFNGAPISIYGSGPASSLWTEDGHPYGMLGTPESPSYGTVGYQEFYGATDFVSTPLMFQSGYGIGLSELLHVGSYMAGGSSVENRVFQVRPTELEYPRLFVNVFGNGELYAGLSVDASTVIATPRVPSGSGRWRFLGVHFQWTSDTTLVVRFRLDGATRTYTLTVPSLRDKVIDDGWKGGYRPVVQVNAGLARSWSNLQAWLAYSPPTEGPWQGESWVSQADVGRGNNELIFLPDVAAADSWDLLKEVVAAEYAVHGFSEYGRYFFRPRTDVRPDRVDHVLDVESNLAEVAYSFSSDTIRNSIGVTTSASYHSGQMKTVVSAQDVEQFVIPAGSTKVFEIDWPHGAAGYQSGIIRYYWNKGFSPDATKYPEWSGDVVHGWTYSSGTSYTSGANPKGVQVRYTQVSARRAHLRVINTNTVAIRLATPASASDPEGQPGEPALRIGGWPLEKVVDRVTTWTNETSIADLGGRAKGGERALPLPSSEWRQSPDAFTPVANALLEALADETPILEDLPVRGDPRVRVGNVASCQFLDQEVPVVGTVVKTRHVLDSDDGLYRTLVSVRPLPVSRLAPPGVEFYVDISRYQAESSTPLDLARLRVLGYAGCVAKIGQGAGTKADGTSLGATLDAYWTTWRDSSLTLWPQATAGYWYVGNVEAPADQAARCLAAIGDPSIPVMLDWEDGAGSFANLLAVLDAFRAVGLLVTMVYAGRGYASANAPSGSSLAGRGVSLISARYWVDTPGAYPNPRADWDDQRSGFGFEPFLGLTPRANQFTQWGVPYPGAPYTDVDAFLGTQAQLAAMFHGE